MVNASRGPQRLGAVDAGWMGEGSAQEGGMAQRIAWPGKVVWITGAGSGIGKALALELAGRGAMLALSGRRRDRLEEVADAIHQAGGRAAVFPCDVAVESEIEATLDAVARTWGKVDVVVANAGFSVSGRIETVDADAWRRQLDVNVVGLAQTARYAIPRLRETHGALVLIGSVAGVVASPGSGPYHASKYAVRAIGQTLAMELHGSGVSCTLVQPGFVESEIAQVDNQGRFDESRPDPRPRRFMWTAERAARLIADRVAQREREVTFTAFGKIAAWLGQHVPGVVHFVITRSGKAYKRAAPTPKNER